MQVATLGRIAGLAGVLALGTLVVSLAGCPGSGAGKKTPDARKATTLTLFGLAEMRGQIEPCGCTTDPLGDLARTAAMIAEARAKGPVVVVDAGSLLYTRSPVPPHLEAQEQLKSDLLVAAYADNLTVAAIGLGPMDLARGPGSVRPARQAANVTGVPVEAPKVIDAGGGVRVGVFGVVSAEMAPGLQVGDPQEAAARAVGELRGKDPALVVALLTMSKKDAVKLLRATDGIDIAILGLGRETPEPDKVGPRAEDIDGAWLVIPGNRGQVVPRLEITLRDGKAPLVDAIGAPAAEAIGAELDVRLPALEKELAGFAADPTADAAFVAQKQQELDELRAERQRLRDEPLRIPAEGSYFTLEQVRIRKAMACDPAIETVKRGYYQAAGAANVAAAKDVPVEPVPPGKAGYVGVEECAMCHAEAAAFWTRTRHAGAWETLEEIGKQFDHDCISCHVTGWDKPGGATMAINEELRDVQCELCHGPGSLHAEDELKTTIRRAPPPELCATQCHTSEHSDTFELEAYLRDVVGPGHGEKLRKELGDGPTGRELRAAGLARAGSTVGAGCTK